MPRDEGDALEMRLVAQPESYTLEWGEGQSFVPAESYLKADDQRSELKRGWLWGNGGEMLSLESQQPLPLEPAVVVALQDDSTGALEPTWQPGLHNRQVLPGVGSARLVTFITYILGIMSLIALPLLLILLGLRRRKNGS